MDHPNAFPSFQKIDSDRQFVVMWTYLDAVPCAEESELDTRNNRDFGDAMIRSVFDEFSVGI